ncbi:alpha/beta hydrolase [Devosia sp. A449]
MNLFPKSVRWALGVLVILLLAYILIGSWQASRLLESTLRVGAATAQNAGWPAPEVPADIGYQGDPNRAFGYQFESIAIDGELGQLPAWFIPTVSPGAATPWALFVHGIGGRRENGYRFLPTFHDAGHPVLMISYRDDSGAPVDPSGLYAFGLTEWPDLERGVRYALQNGAPSVILIAESMGGGIVGQFMLHSGQRDAISAIVLDAPAISFDSILTEQIEKMHLPLAPILARGALLFSDWFSTVPLGEAETTEALARLDKPLFLSHGFIDQIVPIVSSDRLVAMRSAPTTYLRTAADHIQSWKLDPSQYEASLRAFLSTL